MELVGSDEVQIGNVAFCSSESLDDGSPKKERTPASQKLLFLQHDGGKCPTPFYGMCGRQYYLGPNTRLGQSESVAAPAQSNLKDWWVQARGIVIGKNKKKLDSMVVLIAWEVWRERNRRVFDKIIKPTNLLIDHIKNEAMQWALASVGKLILHDT